MKTINSISGGKTSAYIAANYPADYDVFALVRIEDKNCQFPDAKIRQQVEDRIGKPFVGTAEDDMIIYTMLDLEQYIGRPITWVSGITFDEVVRDKGGWLPSKLRRYCTSWLKIDPMFYWWAETIGEPAETRIGYRANEIQRANRMHEKLNKDGLIEYNATFEKHKNGRNKWEVVPWQKPAFPLITDNVYRDDIENYWQGKPVRFAPYNNCVGCFHRHPMFLNFMHQQHPNKVEWFAKQEQLDKGTWRDDVSYNEIIKYKPQISLFEDDFGGCDSGYCGM